MSAAKGREAPTTWFVWHEAIVGRGTRVLDLACGRGRHAIAAAQRGAQVLAVESDLARLKTAEKAARSARVSVQWAHADLTGDPLPAGTFDVVMLFYYLDRRRFPEMLEKVRPGGFFLGETFLEEQRELGWGPTSDEHLLKRGELMSLVAPYDLLLGREVLEVLDGHPRAIASVLAQRPPE